MVAAPGRGALYTGGVAHSPQIGPHSTPSGSTPPGSPLYHEEQRFRQLWLWMLIMAPAMFAWWPFLSQVIGGKPVGQSPPPDWLAVLIWLFIGVGLPALFGQMRLFIDVTADQVVIRYRPFSRRVIDIGEIERVQARTYDAIKEYGGWGIRGWSKEKMAYNVGGNRGVELFLRGGQSLMLGSQRADELAEVIEGRLRSAQRKA
jgi:hypothetical protein